ncbi:hypothetical protein ACW95P_04320 [Candidatus Mycoplasma pogonae]
MEFKTFVKIHKNKLIFFSFIIFVLLTLILGSLFLALGESQYQLYKLWAVADVKTRAVEAPLFAMFIYGIFLITLTVISLISLLLWGNSKFKTLFKYGK